MVVFFFFFFGLSSKILGNRTFWLSCLGLGDKCPQSRPTFWVGRRWGSAGGDADPGWKDTRVPEPPFSAGEFIVSQSNYRTDHSVCLKNIFIVKMKCKRTPHGLQPLPGAGRECLFLCFLWRVMLWNPKGLILTPHEHAEQHRAANCLGPCIPEGIQL